jgi:hypothetical protein
VAFVKAEGLLLAGPDPTGNGGVLPGFGDQREIELLVEAGFTPVEAIRIATENGALHLGQQDRIGSLASGKQADLVLIKGDPSKRIDEIENVETVFKAGIRPIHKRLFMMNVLSISIAYIRRYDRPSTGSALLFSHAVWSLVQLVVGQVGNLWKRCSHQKWKNLRFLPEVQALREQIELTAPNNERRQSYRRRSVHHRIQCSQQQRSFRRSVEQVR